MAWSLLLLAITVALTTLLPVVPGNAARFLIGLALIAARLVSMEWFKKPQHGFSALFCPQQHRPPYSGPGFFTNQHDSQLWHRRFH
jgi:hypothetical protein